MCTQQLLPPADPLLGLEFQNVVQLFNLGGPEEISELFQAVFEWNSFST